MSLLSLALVSSSNTVIGNFPIDKAVEIYQECNNCTYCNFTTVKYPNGTTMLTNRQASVIDTHYYYNLLAGNISTQGTYTYCYNCGNAVEKDTGCLDFQISYKGEELGIAGSILYLGLLAFLLVIFILLLISLHYIPDHQRDDEGFVIDISSLVYLRPVVMGLAWIVLIGITFLASNVAIAYLQAGLFGSFLFLIFKLMMMANFIIIPLCFIAILYSIVQGKKMKALLERGVQLR